MLEKMKFERKEKMWHVLRCICIVMLGILFGIGYLWIFHNAIENLVGKVIDSNVFGILATIIFSVLGIILLILILIVVNIAFSFSEDAKNKSIEKIQFNAEVDEFLRYLDTHEEIPARFKVGLECFPENFRSLAKIRKRSFLVRKESPNSIEVKVLKGKKVIETWSFDDYAYFFEYFEPIYSEDE